MRTIDLTGVRFGRLTAVREAEQIGYTKRWLCRCDCGRTVAVSRQHLRRGSTNSCGCFRRDNSTALRTTHGQKGRPEYRIWCAMKERCLNQSNISYPRYGAKGISVCHRWLHDYAAFIADMGSRPSKNHSIDRIDSSGDYEPSNCRWATDEQQRANRSDNRRVDVNGKSLTLAEAVRMVGVPYRRVWARLHRGWSVERALELHR